MSQLRPAAHRCQIDCTNHEEVISALQLKSKDLYFFWRNYEWLYARYEQSLLASQRAPQVVKEIVTVKEGHEKCNAEIEDLESANDRLTKENKKLRVQLEGCRKQLSELQNSNRYQIEYKKRLALLEAKNTEIEAISQKRLLQINKLKNALKAAEEEAETERAKLARENKGLRQTIVELQQTIDELRRSSASQPRQDSHLQLEEFKSRQVTVLSARMKSLSQEAQRIISVECENMRGEFEQRLEEILMSMSQRELQGIVQWVQEE